MPRIPRRSGGDEESPPEDQRTLSSGDPLAPPSPASTSAATSGDPLTEKTDLSAAPPVTPASTAAPSEADVAPGDASSTQATDQPDDPPTEVAPAADATPTEAPAESGDAQPTVAAPAVEQPTAVLPTSGDPVAAQATTGDPLATPQPTAETGDVAAEEGEQAPVDARPRFRQRTRMRRRLRYLRRLRELAFRDLGGLVFDLHRFGRDRNDLVTAKLEALANIDRELRHLQEGLHDRREFTDLREAGIAACPRCGTLHDTDANFCPGCGTTLRSAIVRDAFPVTVTPEDGQPAPPQDPQQPTPTS